MRSMLRRLRNRSEPAGPAEVPAAPVPTVDRPTTDGDVPPAVAELVALATELRLGPEQLAEPVRAMFHAAADAAHQAGDHLGLPADQARTALLDIADAATVDVNGRGTAAQLEALHGHHGAGTPDLLRRIASGS
jgi:hypothetical protein